MAKAKKGNFFLRWLYRNYRQGSAMGYFISRRIRPTAWLLMGLCGLSVITGADLRQSVVVAFSLLLFGVLVVGFLWALLRRAKVVVRRELPETGSVGEELSYFVEVTNVGKRTLREVHLREQGDDPRPSEWEFLNIKEPGEDERNFFDRGLAYYRWKWLNERGGKWKSLGRSEALSLASGGTQEVCLKLEPKRRGVLVLDDLRVELPDPFGLFQRCRPTGNEAGEILVIPRRYKLPPLRLGGQSELKIGGETASTMKGEGGEFMGLREYRPGDSPRHLHWKAWARTGQPIVKEFEEVRFPRYGLVLDTNLRGSGPELFEEAISVAASFVSTMDRERCLLDLMFVRDEPKVFTAGRGVAKADRLMEILARTEGNDEGGYDGLKNLVLRYAVEMTACVVVLSGWDHEREEFVETLRRSGMEVHLYVIGVGGKPEEASLFGAHWIRWDAVQEDLMKSA
ncbi:DUF58 domain-containing protein [Akkermansiaceae bacterium]|nr:DUF58 domain-containing protein [Akkermansiaceae bacterium]